MLYKFMLAEPCLYSGTIVTKACSITGLSFSPLRPFYA